MTLVVKISGAACVGVWVPRYAHATYFQKKLTLNVFYSNLRSGYHFN